MLKQRTGADTRKNSTLMVVYDLFGSFSRFEEFGFLSRLLQQYDVYSKSFEKVYVKTWESERFTALPPNVEHITLPNLPLKKFLYFFFSGLLKYKSVDYVEVAHITGIIAALPYKLRGAKLFIPFSWDFAEFVQQLKGPIAGVLALVLQVFALKVVDIIAVPSESLAITAGKHTSKDKIYLLRNYVDTEKFSPLQSEAEKVPDLLIFVGRLHQQKNLPMLLETMQQLPQYKLWVIGGGPLRDELFHFMKLRSIKNVEFLGVVTHDELPHLLNMAEAFIFPTLIEGHPKALIEAMACGLPCIGTNVPGIRDVITDGETGLLCDKNVDGIKDAILELFADKGKMVQMGQKARDFAVQNYSMEKILEQRIKLIKGELNDIEPLFR